MLIFDIDGTGHWPAGNTAPGASKLKGRGCVVANLQQNPHARPVVPALLPTLLRNGCMWCIRFTDDGTIKDLPSSEQQPRLPRTSEIPEERYMLGKDSEHCCIHFICLLVFGLLVSCCILICFCQSYIICAKQGGQVCNF